MILPFCGIVGIELDELINTFPRISYVGKVYLPIKWQFPKPRNSKILAVLIFVCHHWITVHFLGLPDLKQTV